MGNLSPDNDFSTANAISKGMGKMDGSEEDFRSSYPGIAKRDLKVWDHGMVMDWLEMNEFGKGEDFSIYAKAFEGMSGKDLEGMRESHLREHEIRIDHRKKMMRAIRKIKKERKFNYDEYIVFKKLQSMVESSPRNIGDLHFLAHTLSDMKSMIETYLNPSFLQDHLEKAMEERREAQKLEEKSHEEESEGEVEDVEEVNPPEEEKVEDSDDEEDEDDLVSKVVHNEDNIKPEVFSLSDSPEKKLNLPVKLVVTEIVRSKKEKTARRILSPVISRIPAFTKDFGLFHTAIIIGPWYLEWTDCALVIPRKLYSGMALISADVETSAVLKDLSFEEICQRLANTICRWNISKLYRNHSNARLNHGNCQDFMEEIMNCLELTIERKGALGKFLDNMKLKGQCELLFTASKEFKEVFNLSLDRYRFDSHSELDDFVRKIEETNPPAFAMDFMDEMKLLKSFDRAFWLRHFKKSDVDTFKPSPAGCPFKDPRDTKSYIVYS